MNNEIDLNFKVYDANPVTAAGIMGELMRDNYMIRHLSFGEGDVILDIGAHVGLFSMCAARMFPGTRIIALEPISHTYYNLLRNIHENGFANQIMPMNLGVDLEYGFRTFWYRTANSGASSFCTRKFDDCFPTLGAVVPLADIFDIVLGGANVSLLKMDCEGAEHSILHNLDTEYLERVDYFRGEIHLNDSLRKKGYTYARMNDLLCSHIKHVYFEPCEMDQ